MMKPVSVLLLGLILVANSNAQTYTPVPENLAARSEFQDAKFGLFIHWGVVISKGKIIYVHILKEPQQPSILVEGITGKVESCQLMGANQKVKFKQDKTGVTINLDGIILNDVDTIVQINTK